MFIVSSEDLHGTKVDIWDHLNRIKNLVFNGELLRIEHLAVMLLAS
jgi:hypothetical protein